MVAQLNLGAQMVESEPRRRTRGYELILSWMALLVEMWLRSWHLVRDLMAVVSSSLPLWGLLVVQLERTGNHRDRALGRLDFCLGKDSRCMEAILEVVCRHRLFCCQTVDDPLLGMGSLSQLNLLGPGVVEERIFGKLQLNLLETVTACASSHRHNSVFWVGCVTWVCRYFCLATRVFVVAIEHGRQIFSEESRSALVWGICLVERSLGVSWYPDFSHVQYMVIWTVVVWEIVVCHCAEESIVVLVVVEETLQQLCLGTAPSYHDREEDFSSVGGMVEVIDFSSEL